MAGTVCGAQDNAVVDETLRILGHWPETPAAAGMDPCRC